MRWIAGVVALLFVLVVHAQNSDESTTTEQTETTDKLGARAQYNASLTLLSSQDIDAAIDGFAAARNRAGADSDLRYRTAFNLGVAYAAKADQQKDSDPQGAMEILRSSAAWFNDAIRMAPEGDEDARVNLELVLRRIQQLADQLNDGNALEQRLARIIDDQRGLRDRIRQLLDNITNAGANAEPVGFQRDFDELATFERALLAEATTIGDLAAEEQALIAGKTDEEKNRKKPCGPCSYRHWMFICNEHGRHLAIPGGN